MAPPLTYDVENEEDEDEEGYGFAVPGLYCAQCESHIHLMEEIFFLRIVRPYIVDGNLTHFDILDDQGLPTYEPAFFDFGCWEEEQEHLTEIQEDIPPVPDPLGILLCDVCHSDILPGESVGLLHFGEMHWSDRSPNNQNTPTFKAMDEGKHICITCICHLDNNRTDPLWPQEIEPVPGVQVCVEGVFERCWRHGNCTCLKSR